MKWIQAMMLAAVIGMAGCTGMMPKVEVPKPAPDRSSEQPQVAADVQEGIAKLLGEDPKRIKLCFGKSITYYNITGILAGIQKDSDAGKLDYHFSTFPEYHPLPALVKKFGEVTVGMFTERMKKDRYDVVAQCADAKVRLEMDFAHGAVRQSNIPVVQIGLRARVYYEDRLFLVSRDDWGITWSANSWRYATLSISREALQQLASEAVDDLSQVWSMVAKREQEKKVSPIATTAQIE